MRDTTGKLNVAKVVDLGQQRTSRKKNKKKKTTENKQEEYSEVAKIINMFEEAPRRIADTTSKNNKNKPKIIPESEKNKEDKNKQEKTSEAAKKTPRTKKKKKHSTPDTPVKMTSPPQEKVKIASNKIKKVNSDSPGLSTRMKPRSRVDIAKLLKLVKPDEQNSPVKTSKFNLLLKSWEISSNSNLTPATPNKPRLSDKMDSQSDQSLENLVKICPGISNAIGQENLESSQTLDLGQSGDWLENSGENLNFWGKVGNY